MAPIISTIEVDRSAEDAFFYVTDPSRMSEWQQGVASGRLDGTGVGSRCTTTRKIGGAQREVVTEITAYDPPHRWADHGIDGPIRAAVSVDVEPLEAPARSRITIEVDFEGHGMGKLLVPLIVRPSARREMPGNMRRLKERLESSG
jgi:Polyketide cyclase / dehydrase and lipid transport